MTATFDDRRMRPRGRLEIEADVAHVAAVRRFVRHHLPAAPAALVDDVVLVASELATNGIEHGDGGDVIVEIGEYGRDVVLRVKSPGASPDLASPEDWDLTEHDAVSGRGLGIIRSVADEVVVHHTDSHLVTAARFRR